MSKVYSLNMGTTKFTIKDLRAIALTPIAMLTVNIWNVGYIAPLYYSYVTKKASEEFLQNKFL